MPALAECIAAQPNRLWLDYGAYAGKLLARGGAPWLELDAAVDWMRKAQSLLKSDVITLPVATVVTQWLNAHPALRSAMAAKHRTSFPLKTLLAEAPLRAHLVQLAGALRTVFPKAPLALALPSPQHWLALAWAQAHAEDPLEIDEDAIDGAAAYMADFLRELAGCGIDVLLLEESRAAPDLQLYQALFNVAAHYRWELGLRLPDAAAAPASPFPGFLVSSSPMETSTHGSMVPPQFWTGQTPPGCPSGGFRFAEIPADTGPESVLERLAVLR
jgi:hypothetical protein